MEGRRAGPSGLKVIGLVTFEALAVIALTVAGASTSSEDDRLRQVNRRLVHDMLLTDLALSTGTSYCRHPSQADLFAPHGDHPSSFEHFPAGSFVAPPPALSASTERSGSSE